MNVFIIENMISMRLLKQYSSTALTGERVRSDDIKTIGPREVMAKINSSDSPMGFHSNVKLSH